MAEKKNDKGQNFEKALERLETIVGEMEGGALSLEKMMAYFEEGTELVILCCCAPPYAHADTVLLDEDALPSAGEACCGSRIRCASAKSARS